MINIKLTLTFILFNILSCQLKGQQLPGIFDACRTGNFDVIKKLSIHHLDILNSQDDKGYTPLILAVYNDHPHIVKFLLSQSVHVDAQDNSGNTALMGAVFKGYSYYVKLLLQHKASVNLQNYNLATALTFAVTFSSSDVVSELLAQEAQYDLKDARGLTPLDHAWMQGNIMAEELIRTYTD
ncbi:ankyrin repeat domain-containing protein [Fulvivirga sp. M361]|uniref:ankyrin repeat domain-containing protein n=1 Tax=Fulvivirga sp. M361 TaxID=2594266 RepID=UPI001179F8F9|nr:ankyrin repeat domain-containing protein [Fulvivirga sp. M361]TRX58217.1 ankyrin repeat domain-containing protein [Fulvivirga sp. M361]